MTKAALRPAVIALAGGLREARTQRGLGLRQLADMIGVSPQLLSAYELGHRSAPETTVAHILGVLRSPNPVREQLISLARRAHEHDFIDHAGRSEDLLRAAYEQRSTHVFEWSPSLIPEALQTVGYASALQETGLLDIDACDMRSLARTVQQLTLSNKTGPRYTFLIGEAATHPDACLPGEVRDQSDAVAAMTRHPRVSVRLVPVKDCPPGLVEPFTLYEDRAGAFAVAVRHHQGAVFLTHGVALAIYKKTAQLLRRRAADGAWP
ncbi:XRE family transcriptional regulator [Amycolatopsis balhimycina DSM 5908]|uniref:XRE family transcriptional regulator n=1 Tax=Amycolatopsis balhimycina DSM 5908 TaxID=1081091 RepID=A0A428VW58_AMYBA|nr:XRE family transcriptional regulator [Amycolatopsis balhimycina DSM 5908]